MCMDFANLNRACPKDSYLLSNIYKVVDTVAGFKYLSSMDTYSRYNQIRMDPDYEKKRAFMIDGSGYCYK